MNQFRDILIGVMLITAAGIGIGHPEQWTWADAGGPYLVNTINFLAEGRPWSVIILCALALALFMTRIKY
jgi:hypothetical protein